MEFLAAVTEWISENEALLSGIAAMIVVAGVVFTPLGAGLHRLLRQRGAGQPQAPVAKARQPAPSVRATTSQRPSVAVLPFANLSDDSEQEFLADGMTEDIITGLSANRHLSVVSRNSTFAYKGRSPDIREVGRELGVRYVLEGSVRRVGERLRTTAQLIDAESGAHLWAEKYDRPYEKIFDVQDEVISSITGALHAQISSAEVERAWRKPADLGAWELVQRALGNIFLVSPSAESYGRIVRDLRSALELDPEYAYARACLAWMLFSRAINGFSRTFREDMVEADAHLRRALESAHDDPLALYYAGAAQVYAGRFEKGIRTLQRSLRRSPHQPDVLMHVGLAHGYLLQFEEAHRAFDRAEALAPSGGMSVGYGWYRAIVLGFERRYEEAVELIQAYLQQASRYGTARIDLALDLVALRREDEAIRSLERALRDDPDIQLDGLCLMVGAYPDPDESRRRVAWLREHWPAKRDGGEAG